MQNSKQGASCFIIKQCRLAYSTTALGMIIMCVISRSLCGKFLRTPQIQFPQHFISGMFSIITIDIFPAECFENLDLIESDSEDVGFESRRKKCILLRTL